MQLPRNDLHHLTTVKHEGKVVLFGIDSSRTIKYTVRRDEPQQEGGETKYWNVWQVLPLPDDKPDASVSALQEKEKTDKFIKSVYTSHDKTALAPIQALSDDKHIYVFRQSTAHTLDADPAETTQTQTGQSESTAKPTSTLYVDRFVLDAQAGTLVRKLEVRFKRSRKKHEPLKPSSGQKKMDSRDFRDNNGHYFFEPTTELCLIKNLKNGWFSIVRVPTSEHDTFRWHVFAYNDETKKIEITSLRCSENGLFDLNDYTVLEGDATKPTRRQIPGIIKRTVELKDKAKNPLTPVGGLTATSYALQKSVEGEDGEDYLIKTGMRVMLAVPTSDHGKVAVLSFDVHKDGTLAQIDETPTETLLRESNRDVILPTSLLHTVKTCNGTTEEASGETERTALAFDGENDYVELADLNPDNTFTAEMWVNPASDKDGQCFLGKHDNRGGNIFLVGYWSGGTHVRIRDEAHDEGGQVTGWHHLAVVVERLQDGAEDTVDRSRVTVYRDGELLWEKVLRSRMGDASGKPWVLGMEWDSATAKSDFFDGQIADVRLWSTARTQQQIQETMHDRLLGRERHLEGFWPLDAVVDGKVLDFSPAGNDGTVHGAHLSGKIVQRTLKDGTTKATAYLNDEVFGVTQGATYLESVDFKTDLDTFPKDLKFNVVFWGRKGGRDGKKIDPVEVPAQIKPLSDGWKRATARFTIPDGMTHLRYFEITPPNGAWNTLELRNHNVERLAKTITQADFEDVVALEPLNESKAMPKVNSKKTKLAVKGALLGFAHCAGNLSAMESVEGAVQLSFFDTDGVLRTPRFDAVSQTWKPDGPGTCLRFDGKNDYVKLADFDPGETFTLEMWLSPGTEWGRQCIISKQTKQGDNLFQVGYEKGTGEDFFETFVSLKKKEEYVEPETITGWHHLAIVVERLEPESAEAAADRSRVTLYRNGHPYYQHEFETGLGNAAGKPWMLGRGRDTDYFGGSMDEVRFWNVALTREEIEAQMHQRLSGTEPGLVGYWPMNEGKGTTIKDHSANGRDGTIKGDASFVNSTAPIGRLPQSTPRPPSLQPLMVFDGVDDYVEVPYSKDLDLSAYTVEVWIRPDGTPNEEWKGIVGKPGRNFNIWLHNSGFIHHQFHIGTGTNAGAPNTASGAIVWNQWNHVAITNDGTTAKTYVNGEEAASGPTGGPLLSHETSLYIGTNLDGNAGAYFKGTITEVRIWNKAHNQQAIESQMYRRLRGDEPGLVGYWPLDEVTSTNKARDKAGDNDGDVLGDCLTTAGPVTVPSTAPMDRPPQQMMNFDGVDDFVAVPAMNVDFSHGLTIEAWVYFRSFKSWSRIIDFGNGENKDNIVLANLGNTDTLVLHFSIGEIHHQQSATNVLKIGKWIHVAATVDAQGKATLYKDGGEVLENVQMGLPGSVRRTSNYIGKSNWESTGDEYFDGQITEVRIWNKARDAEAIQMDMDRRLTGNEVGLVGYWPLDDIVYGKVKDKAGGHDGAISCAYPAPFTDFPMPLQSVVCAEYSTLEKDASGKQTALMRSLYAHIRPGDIHILADKRVDELELRWIGNAQFAPTLLGYIEGAPPIPSENLTEEDDYNSATAVELSMTEDVEYSYERTQDWGVTAEVEAAIGVETEAYTGGGFGAMVLAKTGAASAKAGASAAVDYGQQDSSAISAATTLGFNDRLELRGTLEQQELRGVPEQMAYYNEKVGRRFIPKNVGYALVISSLADVFVLRLKGSGTMVSYQIKPVEDIPPDVNTITFLINPAYTMNGSLDGMIGSRCAGKRFYGHVPEMRAQYGSTYPAGYYRLKEAYDLKQQIEKEDKDHEAFFANFNSRLVDQTSLNRQIGDLDAADADSAGNISDKTGAAVSGVDKRGSGDGKAWQRKMEQLQLKAGKRNIFNTYVWDADGGLRSETQEFANSVSHCIGGSFSFAGSLNTSFTANVFTATAELNTAVGARVDVTMNKTESRSKGFSLNVEIDCESRNVTNHDDTPLHPGEKVDRYRFMSFYLEPKTKHFKHFFDEVVDPEWLASNDEEARALRQIDLTKPNKTWRVFHRVTYIERPALMGFGADKPVPDEQDPIEALSQQVASLEEKLDQVLSKLETPASNGIPA